MNMFAKIIINTNSVRFDDFTKYIKPYLHVFGLPYELVNRAEVPLTPACLQGSLLIIGHADVEADGGQHWTPEELASIESVVEDGIGLVNFDPALIERLNMGVRMPRRTTASALTISGEWHYITALHECGETIDLRNELNPEASLHVQAIDVHLNAAALLYADSEPYLVIGKKGRGRIVQWLGCEWMDIRVRGPLWGLDDLLWRSFVWAARKPFVLREIPPFATLRVDDCVGDHGFYKEHPFLWIDIANKYGFKPWVGFFYERLSHRSAARLMHLVEEGRATAQFHGVYLFGTVYKHADPATDGIVSAMEDWLKSNRWTAPLSTYFIPHNYDLSGEALEAVMKFGVQFIGMPYSLNSGGGAARNNPWLQAQPYRMHGNGTETDGIPWSGAKTNRPLYYAGWFPEQNHTQQVFNFLVEIRDVNGYEWFNYNGGIDQYQDVDEAVRKGMAIMKRCFDSKVAGVMFTHEDSWRGQFIANISPENWERILAGIHAGIADYAPRYATTDEVAQYMRALHTSFLSAAEIAGGDADTVSLTFEGYADCSTDVAIYYEEEDVIQQQWLTVKPFENGHRPRYQVQPPKLPECETVYRGQKPVEIKTSNTPVMLGISFSPLKDGVIEQIRLLSPIETAQSHLVEIWDEREWRRIYCSDQWKETREADGWTELVMETPLPVHALRSYTVAVGACKAVDGTYVYQYHPSGLLYPFHRHYLYTTGKSGVCYPAGGTPVGNRSSGSYFRDIVFRPQAHKRR